MQSAFLKHVGRNIRRLRRESNISQEELARLAKIDRSHIGRIERGEINATLLMLERISKALKTNVNSFVAHR